MSLFNAREWWSTQLASEEGFSERALVIANVDNAPDGKKKIIVGSLSGLLRIFAITGAESLGAYQASDLLLEVELRYPILQVAVGLFLSASDKLHLAILHPRKLSIYSVAGTAGFSEHGSSYNILLIYEHNLQRSAFNLVAGKFGQVKGREFFCVQSLDGTLAFYEQESFAFSRFLPNFLLPGPIGYLASTDSFIVSSGHWALESYRYQVLAISKDGDGEDAKGTTGRGRRVSPDWSVCLSEDILDLEIVQMDKKTNCIVVLGERSLSVFRENGSAVFAKKLDYSPTSMCPYMNNESLMVAVCTEFQSVLVYNSEALKWAAQMPFAPIAMRRETMSDIRGALVFLSDNGFLSCSYLGTAPSLHVVNVSSSENGITNYAEAESELQELKRVISAFNADTNSLTGASLGSKSARALAAELQITISEPITVDSEQLMSTRRGSTASNRPVIAYALRLEATAAVTNVRLMVQLPRPLSADRSIFTYASMASNGDAKQAQVLISLDKPHLAPNLKMTVVAAYCNSSGAPRVQQRDVYLPMSLLARPAPPSKETEHTISLDVVCHASLDLKDLFADLVQGHLLSGDDSSGSFGINFLDQDTTPVTVVMTAKPPKQKFRIKSDSFNHLTFVACELIRRLQSHGVKFDSAVLDKSSLPLESYFKAIDDHLSARWALTNQHANLAKLATQYRTIEKRFLVKLKDRNPTPLNDLDTLLEMVHAQIADLAEQLIKVSDDIKRKTNALSSATDLIIKVLSIGANLKQDQINILRSTMTPQINADLEECWEERTEVALINLLSSHIKDISSDLAKHSMSELEVPKDSQRLKNLISKLVDKTYSGEILSVKNSGNSSGNAVKDAAPSTSTKSNFVTPSNEIIPEEDEDESSTAFNISKPFIEESLK